MSVIPSDGVMPGIRNLGENTQRAYITALHMQGFYGPGVSLEEALDRYLGDPNILGRLRCAMPEMSVFAATQCKWPMLDVFYRQRLTLGGLTADQIAQAYKQAMDNWNNVCGIKLQLATGNQINIDAASGHIDGSSGTLAYSYLPCNASQNSRMAQMFDNAENWSYNWLVEVACHEIGHAIGLDHSPDTHALMYPYSHGGSVPQPQAWDISQAQARYGLPTAPPVEPPPVVPGVPEIGGVLIINGESYKMILVKVT